MKLIDILGKVKKKSLQSEFEKIIQNVKMLNEGQKTALSLSIDTLYNTHKNICISGPAGTGKTFLTKVLLNILESMYDSSKIVLAAPTHQAKRVLSESSGKDAYTIHSLFRILPNLEEDRVQFTQQGKELPKLQDILFLVIDEVSMIDDELFKVIYNKLPMRTKIIALGDPYQLAPINSESISKFFLSKDFVQIRLTEIMRQKEGSPIIEQANKIRCREQNSLSSDNNGEIGLFGYSTEREFLNQFFDKVSSPEEAINNRIIAYTNNTVNRLNSIAREIVYRTTDQIIKNEILVLQQAVIRNDETIFSNGELVKIIDFVEKSQRFCFIESEDEMEVKYYFVTVQSLDTFVENEICIIKDEFSDEFNFKMHCEASQLKNKKIRNPRINLGFQWKQWWENKGFFIDTKPIFASTVHKIQGLSLDNCFVYQKDFDKTSSEDNYYQLLYVAVTRAKNNIYFV